MMKVQFPEDYTNDVRETLAHLEDEKRERQRRFDNGLSIEECEKNIDALLPRLVLLGVREVYHDAFGQNRNLFPHFKHLAGVTYVSQTDVSLYAQWIKTQKRQEAGNTGTLTGYQLPNPNVPYHLQPNFALIYLKKEHEETLEACANLAIKDPVIRSDRPFSIQYNADPKTFTAKDDPADATEIMAEEENANESSQLHDNNDTTNVESDRDTDDTTPELHLDTSLPTADDKQKSNAPVSAPANDNLIPIIPAAPLLGKASQLGKFSPPPSPKDEHKSPVQEQPDDIEEVETLSATDEDQHRSVQTRKSKRK
jgi:hypothetical protein